MAAPTYSHPILSPTLAGYITRRFLGWILGAFFMVGFVIYLIELVDLLRRSTNLEEMTFLDVAIIAGYRVPSFVELAAPILIVVAAVGCFWWMTRSQEFTVMRSTGTSFFQFARPMFVMSGLAGVLIVLLVSPFSIVLSQTYEKALERFSGAAPSQLTVTSTQSGLWISDKLDNGERFILKAEKRVPGPRIDLRGVTLFVVTETGQLATNHQAASALLSTEGVLTLLDVSRMEEDGALTALPDRSYETNLNAELFEAAEKEARLPTFWNLLSDRLNAATADIEVADIEVRGANGEGTVRSTLTQAEQRLALTWHKFLAFPPLLIISVALAAVFSLRMSRKGKTGLMIACAITLAVAFHFLRDILFALSLTGRLSPPVAVWGPIILAASATFLALSVSEDG